MSGGSLFHWFDLDTDDTFEVVWKLEYFGPIDHNINKKFNGT